jgi:hypothetical protein
MDFDDHYVKEIASNSTQGVIRVVEDLSVYLEKSLGPAFDLDNLTEKDYSTILNALALVDAVYLSKGTALFMPKELQEMPVLSDNHAFNAEKILDYLRKLSSYASTQLQEHQLSTASAKFAAIAGTIFHYEFSDGDLRRIQQLINQLRDDISTSDLFEDQHKNRLLTRLEKLQSELHKKVSDLDKFWGLVGDAGVVLGKFGKDAKPIVDRIKEISDIVWRTQSRAEELPSACTHNPLIGNKAESDDE